MARIIININKLKVCYKDNKKRKINLKTVISIRITVFLKTTQKYFTKYKKEGASNL